MYQALYRKYRPKTLEDICGQEAIVKIMKNSIVSDKISHAYLFAGPRGTGKTSLAKVFSKIVNCESPTNCAPCGICVNCTQNNNSDIIEIDAASNNGVDEIRELRSKVGLVPSYGKYKIYIIDEVHMLTTGAFNALLKTLEEPPAHIIFILATTDPHKIPETIISRCQRLDFKKISLDAITNRLKKIAELENIQIEDEALKEIAILSDGGMRDSLGLLDEASAYTTDKITVDDIHDINGTLTTENLKQLLTFVQNKDLENIFKTLDYYNSKGKNFVKLTEEIVLYMRNLLMYKKAPKYFASINNNVDVYKNMDVNDIFLIKYIEHLNECILDMKNTNNPKLMLELALIKMLSINEINGSLKIEVQKNGKNNIEPQKNDNISKIKPIISYDEKTKESPSENIEQTKENELTVPLNTVEKLSLEAQNKLKKLKEIRIDNTLAHFNKKNMLMLKEKLANLNEHLLDPDHSKAISIIMDGILKAASDENMIFMYRNEHLSNSFNENIIAVEAALEKVCGKHYNVISTSAEEWEKIKQEFNGKLRSFVYREELIKLNEIFTTEKDELTRLFGDIIEYS